MITNRLSEPPNWKDYSRASYSLASKRTKREKIKRALFYIMVTSGILSILGTIGGMGYAIHYWVSLPSEKITTAVMQEETTPIPIKVSKLESIKETETITSTETEPDQTVDLETTPLETSTTSQSLRVDIQILKKGHSPAPRIGQNVSVHYTLTLENGKKIDSSRDRGTPFEFTVGKGKVVSGLDEGIQKVLLGSRVRMTIPPDKGYGDNVPEEIIPKGATLIFDIELLKIEDNDEGCVIETGVFIAGGNNVGEMDVENGTEECASQCFLTEGCVAWTLKVQSSHCWLKSDDSNKDEEEGWITGLKECGANHIDGSSTLGGSHTTTYERRTSTETTTKISATSAFATTIEDTTEEQSVQACPVVEITSNGPAKRFVPSYLGYYYLQPGELINGRVVYTRKNNGTEFYLASAQSGIYQGCWTISKSESFDESLILESFLWNNGCTDIDYPELCPPNWYLETPRLNFKDDTLRVTCTRIDT